MIHENWIETLGSILFSPTVNFYWKFRGDIKTVGQKRQNVKPETFKVKFNFKVTV